jgi:tight adherence protein C
MPVQILLPLLGVFLSVGLGTYVLATYLLRRSRVIDRRLRDITDVVNDRPLAANLDLARPTYGSLGKIGRALPKSPQEINRLRRRMTTAGFDQPEAAVLYTVAEIALPVLAGLVTLGWFRSGTGVLVALFVAALAYMAPGFWISGRIAKRKREIQNGLPDALDLLLVSMEAGAGMDQSLIKVSNEMHLAYPALTDEFRRIVTEIRAGRPRAEALRQFAERTKVEEVRSLVLTMIQTDKFGTSIGQALRTHAETARVKRRQRAEERAQKLGVKMVFPLVFCLFPAMFVIVLGPSVLRIIRTLGLLTPK